MTEIWGQTDSSPTPNIHAIYKWPEFFAAGGLMRYSSNRFEAGRRTGNYTGMFEEVAKTGQFLHLAAGAAAVASGVALRSGASLPDAAGARGRPLCRRRPA